MTQQQTFSDIFFEHQGKVSSKYEVYLPIYERVFSTYRDTPVSMLEIGVQNGGSLEVYADYFNKPNILVGCDIDQKCADLQFDDNKIKIVTGNATDENVRSNVSALSSNFDLILDDGSHQSIDIIRTFLMYFPLLNDGGTYIAEDLHTSYWQEFGGGIFQPNSAMNFFKTLTDVINFKHWGIHNNPDEVLKRFTHGVTSNFTSCLDNIYSIEFINSMCVIRKEAPNKCNLGKLKTIGQEANVDNSYKLLEDQEAMPKLDQSSNPWSNDLGFFDLSDVDKAAVFFNDQHMRNCILELQKALMHHATHSINLQQKVNDQLKIIASLQERIENGKIND